MRRLIYVPVVHTLEDLGSLAQRLKEEYINQLGPDRWSEHVAQMNRFWESAREKISSLPVVWEKTKLYQDGLAVCGREMDIAREAARGGSKNYQLILELVERGAQLIGTESADLLVAEYNFLRQGGETQEQRDLLSQRDDYMATRIEKTLEEGETGILFIGLLHQVVPRLPPDMQIECLRLL